MSTGRSVPFASCDEYLETTVMLQAVSLATGTTGVVVVEEVVVVVICSSSSSGSSSSSNKQQQSSSSNKQQQQQYSSSSSLARSTSQEQKEEQHLPMRHAGRPADCQYIYIFNIVNCQFFDLWRLTFLFQLGFTSCGRFFFRKNSTGWRSKSRGGSPRIGVFEEIQWV